MRMKVFVLLSLFFLALPGGATAGSPAVTAGGLIAAQFLHDGSENLDVESLFMFRHARMHLKGTIGENMNGFVQIETKTGAVTLQNAFINLLYVPHTEIRAGYIKLPFGREAFGHPLKNPTIDISKASKEIYRGAHDMGFHLKYAHPIATLWAAAVNGNNGITTTDNNGSKDFCGRLLFSPFPGLGIGGSLYSGKAGTDGLSTTRYGAELNYGKGPILVKGEYLAATDGQAAGDEMRSTGYYAVAAYRIHPQVEGVCRYDGYDPNTDGDEDEWSNITLGLNYYLSAGSWNRLAVNYEIRDDKSNEAMGDLLTVQLQVLF